MPRPDSRASRGRARTGRAPAGRAPAGHAVRGRRAGARLLPVLLLAVVAACARSTPVPPPADRGDTGSAGRETTTQGSAPAPAQAGPAASDRRSPSSPPAPAVPSAQQQPFGQPNPPNIVPQEPPRPMTAPNGVVTPAPLAFVELADLQKELETRRRAGRPVFVNFWATWCAPCVHELPDLGNLAREFAAGGPEVIGVSLDYLTVPDRERVEPKVRDMLEKSGVSYPNFVIMGEQDAFLRAFGIVGGLPFSTLYDGAGRPVLRWSGTVEIDEVRAAAARLRRG